MGGLQLQEDNSLGCRVGASIALIIIERMKILMNILAVSVVCAKRTRPFCPGEKSLVDEEGHKTGDKCKSKPNQYKCAAFFENLTESSELTWLQALPEVLRKIRKKKLILRRLLERMSKKKTSTTLHATI